MQLYKFSQYVSKIAMNFDLVTCTKFNNFNNHIAIWLCYTAIHWYGTLPAHELHQILYVSAFHRFCEIHVVVDRKLLQCKKMPNVLLCRFHVTIK